MKITVSIPTCITLTSSFSTIKNFNGTLSNSEERKLKDVRKIANGFSQVTQTQRKKYEGSFKISKNKPWSDRYK